MDIDLSHSLGGAHNVGRIDGLVGRDHDEFLGAILDGEVGDILGSEDIDIDGLVGVLLHEGHMLVSGGVVDKVGPIGLKDLLHTWLVLDIGDDELHGVDIFLVRLVIAELELQVVERRLCLVKHDNLLGLVLQELTAYLATDRAGGAGDEDRLVEYLTYNVDIVNLDRITTQEVLNSDITDLR